MPALNFLHRKWLVACDDLVIPFAIEATLRAAWLVCLGVLLWLNIKDCQESAIINYFLHGIAIDLFFSSCLSFGISVSSARGHVLEVEKRKFVSTLMYVKLLLIFFDFVGASCGVWFFIHVGGICYAKEIFIKSTTIGAWVYLLIMLIALLVCYDTLGSSKCWNIDANPNSLNFFKKAQYIWKMRLKLFCCCADISEDNDLIYVEISTFLASFLNGSDLVPTDILAGIITLSEKHALERKSQALGVLPVPYSSSLLDSHSVPAWMTPENALYFLRIAKSTYGWIAFYDTFHPWNLCVLSSHIRCCVNCCGSSYSDHVDNCCYCNFAAVQKITGLTSSDILYASFENNIHQPAFYIAVDHNRTCIVIAIRGTRSFSDLVTDLDGETLDFPLEKIRHQYKCHRGALRSAIFVYKKITELNVLSQAMTEHPTYNLVITGHSLGGSVATILALMLRPKHPNLQCYAYGPMTTLSSSGVPETLDTVFSVVVGDDMAPRLSTASCRELRLQLMDSLRECKLPKYKILTRACLYHIQKYLNMKPQRVVCEIYENHHCQSDEENMHHPDGPLIANEASLYAPGRILYFERNKWNEPYWVTGLNLQHITINPDMIADHQPHKIQNLLEMFVRSPEQETEA